MDSFIHGKFFVEGKSEANKEIYVLIIEN